MTHDPVTAAARGDLRAFATLVRTHQSRVCAIALATLRDPVAAEEAAQEAFLTAWRRLPELREPGRFAAWLRQIALNQARMHARSLRRAEARVVVDEARVSAARSASASPEHRVAVVERDRMVRAALDALPEDCREVLVLFHFEGQSSAEVARQLSLSDAAVRKRLSRARAALREDLAARLPVELRDLRPTSVFVAAVIAAATAWPRAASAGTARAVRTVGLVSGAAFLGALAVLALPLVAASPDLPPPAEAQPVTPSAVAPPAAVEAPEAVVPAMPQAPRTPVEEALVALSEAGGLALVRCNLDVMSADGIELQPVHFSGMFLKAERVEDQLVGVLDDRHTDLGQVARPLKLPVPGVPDTDTVVIHVEGAAPATLATCRLTVEPRRVDPPPPVPSGLTEAEDRDLDRAVAEVILAFQDGEDEVLAASLEGSDPFGFALQRSDLSMEARASLERWREGWRSGKEFDVAGRARELLEELDADP